MLTYANHVLRLSVSYFATESKYKTLVPLYQGHSSILNRKYWVFREIRVIEEIHVFDQFLHFVFRMEGGMTNRSLPAAI